MATFFVSKWHTPISNMYETQLGRWRVKKKVVPIGKGSWMESFNCDSWKARKPISITILTETIKWEGYVPDLDPPEYEYEELIWMSDSPAEFFGMWDLINRIDLNYENGKLKPKNILIGGLGLGLIIFLLCARKDIDKILVIELEPDIIALTWKYVMQHINPDISRIIQGDFLLKLPELAKKGYDEKIDVIIADIWQTNDKKGTELFKKTKKVMDKYFPNSQHLYWLFQNDVEKGEYD
jgi:hypothetical protein